jgi:hypothetical protein
LALACCWCSPAHKPRVAGQLSSQDVSEIQRVASRYWWAQARQALEGCQFNYFFKTCLREIVMGRSQEVGETQFVDGVRRPGQAYILTGYGAQPRTAWKYDLQHTTNGWKIGMLSYRYGPD